ncbi:MAG: hypothetical protein AAF850_04950 [Pseudomonadota bacterium]
MNRQGVMLAVGVALLLMMASRFFRPPRLSLMFILVGVVAAASGYAAFKIARRYVGGAETI